MNLRSASHISPLGQALRFLGVYWGIAVALTMTAIYLSWSDKSWGALWIAIIAAPIANLILMILGLIAGAIYRRYHPLVRGSDIFPWVVVAPLIGCITTAVATFMMDLHGC